MPFIAREDGEHFVVPSYRDVLVARQKSALKKDVFDLGVNYGEFLAMQRRSPQEYEVAFASDRGYLLGESIWHQFNRPADMIYCEVLPNTGDAILVIVKNGNVYLDGSFPIESITDELVVFLTQENNFEIYVYGDVPISDSAESGKFSFDASSVKSFNVLTEPVFNTLPLLKQYQLLPIDETLKQHGIGTIHILPFVILGGLLALGILIYLMVSLAQRPAEIPMEPNPYQLLVDALASPPPNLAVKAVIDATEKLLAMPGWDIKNVSYSSSSVNATVVSNGTNLATLLEWCAYNGFRMTIKPTGVEVAVPTNIKSRTKPKIVYPIKDVLIILLDRIKNVYPGGDVVKLTTSKSTGPYSNVSIKVNFTKASLSVVRLIGEQLKGLPLAIENMTMTSKQGIYDGTITVKAYGT